MAVWRFAFGGLSFAVCGRRVAFGGCRFEVSGLWLAVGGWRLAVCVCRFEVCSLRLVFCSWRTRDVDEHDKNKTHTKGMNISLQ